MDTQATEEGITKSCQKPNEGVSVDDPFQGGYSTPQSTGLDEGRTLRSSSLRKKPLGVATRSMSSLQKARARGKSSIRRSLTKGKDSTPRLPAKGKSVTPEVTRQNMISTPKATSRSKDNNPRASPQVTNANSKLSPYVKNDNGKPSVQVKNENQMPSPKGMNDNSKPLPQVMNENPKPSPHGKNNNPRPSSQDTNENQMSSVIDLSSSPRVTTRSTVSSLMPTDTNLTQKPSPQGMNDNSKPSPQVKNDSQMSSAIDLNSSPRLTTRSMVSTLIPTDANLTQRPSLQDNNKNPKPSQQGNNNPRPSPKGKNYNQMSSVIDLSSSPRVATRSTVSSLIPTDTNLAQRPSPQGMNDNSKPSLQVKTDNQMSSTIDLNSSPRVTTRSMVSTVTPTDTNLTQRPSPHRKGSTQVSSTLGGGVSQRVTTLVCSTTNITETDYTPNVFPQLNCDMRGSPTLAESSSPRVRTRSMHFSPLPTAKGEIGIQVPSPQCKSITQSPASKSNNNTQTVTSQDVDITIKPSAMKGNSNSESSAQSTSCASKLPTQDETVILTSPTRAMEVASKPSESIISSSLAQDVEDAATFSVNGECSIPRRTTRSKGGAVTPANHVEGRAHQQHSSRAPYLDEKGRSLEKHTREDPCLTEKCASRISSTNERVAPLTSLAGEIGGSVASFSNVVLPILPAGPSGSGSSLNQYPADVRVSVKSCPVEAIATVPPRPSEIWPNDIGVQQASSLRGLDGPTKVDGNKGDYSKASAEKDGIPPLDKPVTTVTIATSGKNVASKSQEQNDGGVWPITSSNQRNNAEDTSQNTPCDKETAMGSSHCTNEAQTSFQSGVTRDAPSVVIFNTTVETFLENLVEAGSYQRFAKCYQRFYKFQPEMTRSIYDQFITQLKTSFKDEIQEIKEEGSLEALLDSLDKIKDDAKGHVEPAWRPSGIPEEDLQSTLVPYYLQQKEYMRQVLKEKESENAKLAESVLAGRKRIAELQQQIQKRKESWLALGKAKTELVMGLEELKPESLKWDH